jgi:polysaccharide deacetylase family protein (PEP-CTERM system associated)
MAMILTIDVEDWYQTSGINLPVDTWDQYEDRLVQNTMEIIELLDQYQVKATFFILGCVAQRHPYLVKTIQQKGHEIGSHGGWHQMVNTMTLDEFKKDLQFSIKTLEDITGVPIRYYRAPSWSISADRYEALSIMEEEGIICDSSLQPFRTPLSGNSNVPLFPFHPVIGDKVLKLVELPPSVLDQFGMKIPFSGGFYLRFWPSWFSIRAFRIITKKRVGMVYIHPWEFDTGFPRIKLSPLMGLAQYYNLRTMRAKFEAVLRHFSFVTLGEYLQENSFAEYQLLYATKGK